MPAHSPSKKAEGFFVGEPLHYSAISYDIKKEVSDENRKITFEENIPNEGRR